MKSLRAFAAIAVLLLLVTVWILPLPAGTRLFVTVVLLFCGVFVFVDATGKGRVFAAITVALLGLYLALTAQRGFLLLRDGGWVGALLGLGMILLPALGAWALVREVLFGTRVQGLARRLEAEGGLPPDDLPRTPAGKVLRQAADAEFERRRAQVEEDPEDWRTWFRLAVAYDDAGDRKRARRAMRDAVGLSRGRPARNLAAGEARG